MQVPGTRYRLWKIKSYGSKTLNSRSPGIYIGIAEPMIILSERFDERLKFNRLAVGLLDRCYCG